MNKSSRAVLRASVVGATLLSVVAGAAVAAPPAPARGPDLPHTYVVSGEPGFLPEGIAIHASGRMYVGSDGNGDIRFGRVRHATMRDWTSAADLDRSTTLGVHTDKGGRVYSVGADTITSQRANGRLISRVTVPAGVVGPAKLNDLAITKHWVYVTDFANPVVYRLPRHANGKLGPAEAWLDMRDAAPGFPAQYWFLNGIVASPDGETLLVASNGPETTWRVDTGTKAITKLEIDTPSFGPDGMAVHGSTLYAVLNHGAPDGVYVAELNDDWTAAHLTDTLTTDSSGAAFDTPTTLAVHKCRIYVVNSQNRDAPGVPPYTVSTVGDPSCK